MPRILYITSRPPYPLNSGFAIRNFHLLRAYARWGRVALMFLYRDAAELEAARPLWSECDSVHPIPLDSTTGAQTRARSPRWQRALRHLLTSEPSSIAGLFSKEMATITERLAASSDVVHVTPLHMVVNVKRMLSRSSRPRVVLDLPDLETIVEARRLRFGVNETLAHRILNYYDSVRLWRFQTRAVRAFDRVFVCSPQEKDHLRGRHVSVVPNGSDVPPALPPSQSNGPTILFCGSLSYGANIDGLEFFVQSISPEIRRAVPDLKLIIVGRQPPAWVHALDDGKSIVVASDVGSVSEYYQRATISVVPLRVGGGTRLKILESWALGVPVVSTRVGCEGLEAVAGQHLLVADDAGEFAQACVALLRDPDLRHRLTVEGRALVARRYRWDDIASDAVASVRGLVDASRGR